MRRRNKGQAQMVFVFILVAVIIGMIVLFGFMGIKKITESSQDVVKSQLVNNLRSKLDSVRRMRGSSESFEHNVPGGVNRICFVRSCSDNCGSVYGGAEYTSIKQYQGTEPQKNFFLMDGGIVNEALSLEQINVTEDSGVSCQNITRELKLRVTGQGDKVLINASKNE